MRNNLTKSVRLAAGILFAILSLAFSTYSIAQTPANEAQLKKEASKYFEDEDYVHAYPLYSQLLSLYPQDPNYNYRFAACMLFTQADKQKPIDYLEHAVLGSGVDNDAFYYIGLAYHLNYRFDDAIREYNFFKSRASSSELRRHPVDHLIEMCNNGKNLLRNLHDLDVLRKKQLTMSDYYEAYDLTTNGGSLLVEPDDFKTKTDKKKNLNSIIYLSPDKTLLFFASYGDDDKNGKDIYMSRHLPNGQWGKPENLGSVVNTQYDEDYPFYDAQTHTLYFCSKGHNSMGGYDIFKSTYNDASNTWSAPINMDFPINTPGDDILFVADTLNETAFFSSNRSSPDGSIEVYKIRIQSHPPDSVMLNGIAFSDGGATPVASRITVKDVQSNEVVGIFNSSGDNGGYTMSLVNGGKFMFTVETPNHKTQSDFVNLPVENELAPLRQRITYDMSADRLIITNLFGIAVGDSNYLVAMNLIQKKALMNVNVDTTAPIKHLISVPVTNNNNAQNNTQQNTTNNNTVANNNTTSNNKAASNNNTTTQQTSSNNNNTAQNNSNNNSIAANNNQNNSQTTPVDTLGNDTNESAIVDTTGKGNVNNQQLAQIAYKDAKQQQQQAQQDKEEANKSTEYANSKMQEALQLAKQAQQTTTNANNITDPKQKQDSLDKANTLTQESQQASKKAIEAYQLASQMQNEASTKQIQADQSTQYSNGLDSALKSSDPKKAMAKLQSQRDSLAKQAEKNPPPLASAGDLVRQQAQDTKQDSTETAKHIEKLQKETDRLQQESEDYVAQAQKTDNSQEKVALLAQAKDLDDSKKQKQQQIVDDQKSLQDLHNQYTSLINQANQADSLTRNTNMATQVTTSDRDSLQHAIDSYTPANNNTVTVNNTQSQQNANNTTNAQNNNTQVANNTSQNNTNTQNTSNNTVANTNSNNQTQTNNTQTQQNSNNTQNTTTNNTVTPNNNNSTAQNNNSTNNQTQANNNQTANNNVVSTNTNNQTQNNATQPVDTTHNTVAANNNQSQQNNNNTQVANNTQNINSNTSQNNSSNTVVPNNNSVTANNTQNTNNTANTQNSTSNTVANNNNTGTQNNTTVANNTQTQQNNTTNNNTSTQNNNVAVNNTSNNNTPPDTSNNTNTNTQPNNNTVTPTNTNVQPTITYSNNTASQSSKVANTYTNEAANYSTQADNLRDQARQASPAQAQVLNRQADSLDNLASDKKNAAEIYQNDANGNQYLSNQQKLTVWQKTMANNTSNQATVAQLLNNDATQYYKQAAIEKQKADSSKDPYTKQSHIDNETQALATAVAKQQKAEDLYLQLNPQLANLPITPAVDTTVRTTQIANNTQNNSNNTVAANNTVNNNQTQQTANNTQNNSTNPVTNNNVVANNTSNNNQTQVNNTQIANNNTTSNNTSNQTQTNNTTQPVDTTHNTVAANNNQTQQNNSNTQVANNTQNNTSNNNTTQNNSNNSSVAINNNQNSTTQNTNNTAANNTQQPDTTNKPHKTITAAQYNSNITQANNNSTNNTQTQENTNTTANNNVGTTVALTVDVFQATNASPYTAAHPIPINPPLPEGLVFKIQVGAFRNPIPQNEFKGIQPVMGETTPMGFIRYTAGLFKQFDAAQTALNKVHGLGYRDAFIVAFYNGKRIPINDAMARLGQPPIATSNNTTVNNTQNNATTNNTQQPDNTNAAPATSVTDVKGLFYTVQVAAFVNPVPASKLFNLSPLFSYRAANGYIRYNCGIYSTVPKATAAKDAIVGRTNLKDAFVVAYYNGERITLIQATQLISNGSATISTNGNIDSQPNTTNGGNTTVPVNNTPVNNTPVNNTQTNNNTNPATTNAINNSTPVDTNKVSFTVQVGAYSGQIPLDVANNLLKIASEGIHTHREDNGITVYTVGNYADYTNASAFKDELVQDGFPGCFVVAYYKGKKISLQQAQQLMNK